MNELPNMPDTNRPRIAGNRKIGGEGEPEVFVADEQTLPVDIARWADLTRQVLHAEGIRGNTELSLLFVDETAMTELNHEFMGIHSPTDVLAFPIDAEADLGSLPSPTSLGPDRSPVDIDDIPLLLGDVVICPAVANRQAPTHAGTIDDEMALLVVHGLLHVLGHDHAQEDEKAIMRARECELLEQFHWHGPTPSSFRQEHPDE
jgi:probable rRNA maturation factor